MTSRLVKSETDRWYDWPGFEDRYELTRDGKVGSKRRRVNSPIAGGSRMIGGNILKLANVKGYLAVQPVVDGKRLIIYLHRAIAMLFVANPDNKPHVNHKDGDKQNNYPANLEWCTHKENMRHAFQTGLAPKPTSGPGALSPAAKLDATQVATIRQLLTAGSTQALLAKRFGVSKSTVGWIARNQTWAQP